MLDDLHVQLFSSQNIALTRGAHTDQGFVWDEVELLEFGFQIRRGGAVFTHKVPQFSGAKIVLHRIDWHGPCTKIRACPKK